MKQIRLMFNLLLLCWHQPIGAESCCLDQGFASVLPPDTYQPYREKDVAFSPDGSVFVIIDHNLHGLAVFTIKDGALGNSTSFYPASCCNPTAICCYPTAVVFSPTGTFLVTSAFGYITTYEVSGTTLSNATSYTRPFTGPYDLAVSPDGSLLATGNGSPGDVTMFKVANGTLEEQAPYYISHHGSFIAPYSLVFSPDGTYLVVAGNLGVGGVYIVVLQVTTDGALSEENKYITGAVNALKFSPDGSLIAYVLEGFDSVNNGPVYYMVVQNLINGQLTNASRSKLPSNPTWLAFSPDSSCLATKTWVYEGDKRMFYIRVYTIVNGTLSTCAAYPDDAAGAAFLTFLSNGSYPMSNTWCNRSVTCDLGETVSGGRALVSWLQSLFLK